MDSTSPIQPTHKAPADKGLKLDTAHPEQMKCVEGRRDSNHAISPCSSLGVAGAPEEQRRMEKSHEGNMIRNTILDAEQDQTDLRIERLKQVQAMQEARLILAKAEFTDFYTRINTLNTNTRTLIANVDAGLSMHHRK